MKGCINRVFCRLFSVSRITGNDVEEHGVEWDRLDLWREG